MKKSLKKILIKLGLLDTVIRIWTQQKYLKKIKQGIQGVHKRDCPCCDYHGSFLAFGTPPRYDAKCPSCGSLERHRLLFLVDMEKNIFNGVNLIIHFAPEPIVKTYLQSKMKEYVSADLFKTNVDRKEDIENISFLPESVDAILCSHVLEHVNDKKALKSIYRVLKPGGKLITMIPLCEGWETTYENKAITEPRERDLHFGQYDHVRYYGRDFTKRFQSAGFDVQSFTARPEDCIRYSLIRGEKVFVGIKPKEVLEEKK